MRSMLRTYLKRVEMIERTQENLRKLRDLVEGAEKMARNPDLIPIIGNPQKSCKRCYGRGHTGRDSTTRLFILCSCIFTGTPIWMANKAKELSRKTRIQRL